MKISPCLVEQSAGMNEIARCWRNQSRVGEWGVVIYEAKEECPHPTVADKW